MLPHPLKRTSPLALVIELFLVLAFFAVFSTVTGEPAKACGWCAVNAFDEAVRGAVVADDRLRAGTASHALSFALIPALSLGGTVGPALFSARKRAAAQDALIVVIAFLLTTGVTDGVKKIASRQRPGFHHGMLVEGGPTERFVSFFSGDTAWAFCVAACGATLAYLRGYKSARAIAIIGGLFAIVCGLLRIRADMHWATDVMTGATVGTLCGVGLPMLLHRRDVTPRT